MKNKTLVFGIGNCGRADDGLGWAFLDAIDTDFSNKYDIEYRYQLQIEDAELASHYKQVIFVDAFKGLLENGFEIKPCFPIETHQFTTHELAPETVIFLTNHVYNKTPKAYIIGIEGREYGLKMGLSEIAKINLNKSLNSFIKEESLFTEKAFFK